MAFVDKGTLNTNANKFYQLANELKNEINGFKGIYTLDKPKQTTRWNKSDVTQKNIEIENRKIAFGPVMTKYYELFDAADKKFGSIVYLKSLEKLKELAIDIKDNIIGNYDFLDDYVADLGLESIETVIGNLKNKIENEKMKRITKLKEEINGFKIAKKGEISHFMKYHSIYGSIRDRKFEFESLVLNDLVLKLEGLAKDINNHIIDDPEKKIDLTLIDDELKSTKQGGGKKSKKQPKKEVNGVSRCIYKIPGDRKEYVRSKGKLITLKNLKKNMKPKKRTKT
jgi:hypothetical protein